MAGSRDDRRRRDETSRRGGARKDRGGSGRRERAADGRRAEPDKRGRPARPRRTETARERHDEPRPPRPRLPGNIYRDLRAAAGDDIDRVAAGYAEAGEALERGDVADAVTLLRDAKERAKRSVMVREALGIALYLHGRYAEAGGELAAYRRMAGRLDQNHLAADCARAEGNIDRAEALVAEMMAAEDVPADRVAEGLLVIAGARADDGDARSALAALHRADLEPAVVEPYHLRLWYLAADLHERLGEARQALQLFDAVATIDPDFLDVDARLRALDDTTTRGGDAER